MIETLILAAQLAVASPSPVLPQDWSSLRPLPLAYDPGDAPNLSAFVQGEVKAGRCAAAVATSGGWVLKIDLAVLVGPAAQPRRVVPRAIDCPSVEQYAAGLISSAARGNIPLGTVTPETWYRTSLTFSWPT
jgi:hypothetical protein